MRTLSNSGVKLEGMQIVLMNLKSIEAKTTDAMELIQVRNNILRVCMAMHKEQGVK